jgi:hypothetical protein
MRPPVLIIGAHRSGTSATAHALQILGLQIGEKLDSHYEPKHLQQLHEEYLRKVGASWHEPASFLKSIQTADGQQQCVTYLEENIGRNFAGIFGYRKNPRGLWMLARTKLGGATWGWKEPRTTLFAPAWIKIFPGARLLHVARDPMAAAKSIRERELRFQAAGDPASGKIQDLNYCLDLVHSYAQVAERFNGDKNYSRVQFEDLQSDPRKILDEIGRSCGLRFSRNQLDTAAATIRR